MILGAKREAEDYNNCSELYTDLRTLKRDINEEVTLGNLTKTKEKEYMREWML
jgi:hypothetical protein